MTTLPKLLEGGLSVDDRGQISFINSFDPFSAQIRRFYLVSNHSRGFVRAWHGHKKESKFVFVVKGAIVLGTVPIEGEQRLTKFVLSDKKPQVLAIPANYYNGFITLTEDTQIMFFSTSTLEESQGDDYRLPASNWDISTIEER